MLLRSHCSSPFRFDSYRIIPAIFRFHASLKPSFYVSQGRFLATIPAISHEDADSAKHNHKKKGLVGLTLEELKMTIEESSIGAQRYTANQIWQFMYRHGATSFSQMTSLSLPLRKALDEQFTIDYGHVKLDKLSTDGTRKFLVMLDDNPRAVVETVVIPEQQRGTLCLSSQVGCSLNCKFCHTGTQKLLRNLTAGEVVGQYMIAASVFGDFPLTLGKKREVTNIVYMGQGEPLYNWKNVSKSIRILTDPTGLSFPPLKLTVSTSGIAPLIPQIALLGASLAISLHAPCNDLRDVLVPLNRTYPIQDVMKACHDYVRIEGRGKNARRITFEYVMLRGVNDGLAEAREVVRLLKEVPGHVNLIPFNPWPGSGYQTSLPEQIELFAKVIKESGMHCTVRSPRGQDIMAACGQLKSTMQDKSSARI
ncbi:Cfr family radical SAM protein [Endogone sp. FLAS-F59071]|nr:Cfr family radical SAM protein [Endogone sp. FLAS-F59071]|eukprot:RUS18969.1 Cfr family radical SAM protein [Endogone sp. FLAS-F59071]